MNSLLCSSHLRKLSFLGPMSSNQVTRYLSILEARNYAHSTTISVIEAIRRFALHLPPLRLSVLKHNFTLATPHDVDCFVAAVREKGLAPSTINGTLSWIKEFFDFLREEGEMLVQPVIRRRHRLCAPNTLPKPLADDDLVQFFKVIDSIRDRAFFLLMLRCGLRVSEVAHLKVSDIDWEQKALLVEQG
jgi:site-specific recombinase XerD